MASKRSSARERRVVIRIGVPAWRKQDIQAAASAAGQSLSDWARDCIYRCLDGVSSTADYVKQIEARILRLEARLDSMGPQRSAPNE